LKIIASRDLLPKIRHRLSEVMPTLGSSHLAEVVARLFGHRTNAALVDWRESVSPLVLPVVDVNLDAALKRLANFDQTTMVGPEKLTDALISTGAVVTGPTYMSAIDDFQELNDHYFEGGWDALSNHERIVQMLFLMSWRTKHASMGNFVEEFAERGGRDIHLRLAGIIHGKRDFDRQIADFLVDALIQTEIDRDRETSRISHFVDSAFQDLFDRIASLMDAICTTWDPSVDPLLSPKLSEFSVRRRRPVTLTTGRGRSDAEVGLLDVDGTTPNISRFLHLCGIAMMASGASLVSAATYAGQLETYETGGTLVERLKTAFAVEGDMVEACDRMLSKHMVLDELASRMVQFFRTPSDTVELRKLYETEGFDVAVIDLVPSTHAAEAELDKFKRGLRHILRLDGDVILANCGGRPMHEDVGRAFEQAAEVGYRLVFTGLLDEDKDRILSSTRHGGGSIIDNTTTPPRRYSLRRGTAEMEVAKFSGTTDPGLRLVH
jgi:hypothetical protein